MLPVVEIDAESVMRDDGRSTDVVAGRICPVPLEAANVYVDALTLMICDSSSERMDVPKAAPLSENA